MQERTFIDINTSNVKTYKIGNIIYGKNLEKLLDENTDKKCRG